MAKTEGEIILSARERSKRMQADIVTLIEKLVTIQISENLDVTKSCVHDIDSMLEKWKGYINSIDYDIQEAFFSKKL